jgi:hypothetical protein
MFYYVLSINAKLLILDSLGVNIDFLILYDEIGFAKSELIDKINGRQCLNYVKIEISNYCSICIILIFLEENKITSRILKQSITKQLL